MTVAPRFTVNKAARPFGPGRLAKHTVSALLLISLFFCGPENIARAEKPLEIQQEKTLGGKLADLGLSAAQTSDGGFVVVGQTLPQFPYGKGGLDLLLAKIDASGSETWKKNYGGNGTDYGSSVLVTADGGYIIAGTTKNFPTDDKQVYLIKTDAEGRAQWQKSFGGAGDDTGVCVRQTSDGGYIIAADTYAPGAQDTDFYLIKTDAAGKKEWEKTYGGKGDESVTGVRQTADGGYIAAGRTFSYGAGGYDAYLVKTGPSGNMEWEKTFGGSGWDAAFCVEQAGDGGYVMAGQTFSPATSSYDVYLVKTGPQGNLQWEKAFGGGDLDTGKTVQEASDGGYIISGWTNSFGLAKTSFYLVRTDSGGGMVWEKTLEGGSFDERFFILQTVEGGYIVAGWRAETLDNREIRNDGLQVYLAKIKVAGSLYP